MKKRNMTKECGEVVRKLGTPEMKDWGFSFIVNNELEALQVAYSYRNNPYGTKIDHCVDGRFMVTMWNAEAKEMGCDC